MADQTTPQRWALVIGIDDYSEGTDQLIDVDGMLIEYHDLSGCVSDALDVERYLIDSAGVDKQHIIKLLAPLPRRVLTPEEAQDGFTGTQYERPTYKAILSAMETLLTSAQSGDAICIHYAGHGARATTVFPDLKGPDSLDEAFAPCDIYNGGRFLRGLEVSLLLHKMAQKGLRVTLVADCCHSAGTVRKAKETYRVIEGVYKSLPRDVPASIDDIRLNKPTRLGEAKDFSVLAAAQPSEFAKERNVLVAGKLVRRGAFTYSLMATLREEAALQRSVRVLRDRVCAMIRDEDDFQTPHFIGRPDHFFGHDANSSPRELVMRRLFDAVGLGDKIELAGGAAHGVLVGSVYAAIPLGAAQPTDKPMRLIVTKVWALKSDAMVDDAGDTPDEVKSGCRAALVSLPVDTRCLVHFHAKDPELMVDEWNKAGGVDDCWLQLAENESTRPITFNVDIDAEGVCHVKDALNQPWPNLCPPLPPVRPLQDPLSMELLVRRLRHLAQYQAVRSLTNAVNVTSKLQGKFSYELVKRTVHSFQPLDPAGSSSSTREIRVNHGEEIHLKVKNLSDKPFYFVILDLKPLYGIDTLYPDDEPFHALDPGREVIIDAIQMVVPPKLLQSLPSPAVCLDVFKLIVVTRGDSFQSLHLRDIVESQSRSAEAEKGSALEKVLQQMRKAARDGGRGRDVGDWQADEISVWTARSQ